MLVPTSVRYIQAAVRGYHPGQRADNGRHEEQSADYSIYEKYRNDCIPLQRLFLEYIIKSQQ